MAIWDFLTEGASKVIDSIGNAIDKLTTTDEEKAQLKNQLAKEMNSYKLAIMQARLEYEKQLTERQKNDMTSDSWLSKNIRPLMLILVFGLFTILSITNGFAGLKFDQAYIDTIRIWGITAFTFYFGSRGFEKVTKLKGEKNENG